MAKVNIERLPGESEADFKRRYHRAWEDQDRRAKGIQPKRKPDGPCGRAGCERPAEIKGMCGNHYRIDRIQRRKAAGIVETGKRSHPLYSTWLERKHRKGLCVAWLDFAAFTEAVGERPSPNHALARLVQHELYGPENWEWREQIRRGETETVTEFNARKWQAQKVKRPDFDIRRGLIRKYGIDEEQYLRMHQEQDGCCAICGKPETKIDKRRGKPKNLSVDHCHQTMYARDLLCFSCNAALGLVGDSASTLQAMVAYVEKWADAPATTQALGRPPRLTSAGQKLTILETQWGPLPLQEAARRAALKPGTVESRLRKGWPMDKLLQPLRRPPWRIPAAGGLPLAPNVGDSPPPPTEEDEIL